MSRRTPREAVTVNVLDAMSVRSVSPIALSEATGIPSSTLSERLDNESEFTWGELQDVGGFLHVSPDRFFEGVTA